MDRALARVALRARLTLRDRVRRERIHRSRRRRRAAVALRAGRREARAREGLAVARRAGERERGRQRNRRQEARRLSGVEGRIRGGVPDRVRLVARVAEQRDDVHVRVVAGERAGTRRVAVARVAQEDLARARRRGQGDRRARREAELARAVRRDAAVDASRRRDDVAAGDRERGVAVLTVLDGDLERVLGDTSVAAVRGLGALATARCCHRADERECQSDTTHVLASGRPRKARPGDVRPHFVHVQTPDAQSCVRLRCCRARSDEPVRRAVCSARAHRRVHFT